jgi:hypothetical protein
MDRDQLIEHLKFAAELGVEGVSRDPVWRHRSGDRRPAAVPAPADPERAPPSQEPVGFSRNPAEALAAVRADLGDCTRCKLHTMGRKQIVFGVGNPDADLMFVGEAPGADEDIQGKIDKDESEKLVRYQRLLKKAEDVFGGGDSAREWLTSPQAGLGNAVPLDFAKTEIGAREVENLLGSIEYGVYS